MVKKCCRCGKIQVDDTWVDPPLVINDDISHGYCPECYTIASNEIDEVNRIRARLAAQKQAPQEPVPEQPFD